MIHPIHLTVPAADNPAARAVGLAIPMIARAFRPAEPSPAFTRMLAAADPTPLLQTHARALAVADHAAEVDDTRRVTVTGGDIAEAARAMGAALDNWPEWWSTLWTTAYQDARDDLAAGDVAVLTFRNLDEEHRQYLRDHPDEAAREAAEVRASSYRFPSPSPSLTSAARGGPGPDEPDPFDAA